jgi:hypothetical protein
MKVKRILAAAMATTMILGTSMVAFATEPAVTADIVDNGKGVYSTSVTTDTTFQAPIVKVIVPTATPVYLNPYGIATTIAAVEGVNAAVTNSKAQIVAATYKIQNMSNVPVKIDAAITTTATGAVLLASDATTENLTTKWVKVSASIKGATGVTTTPAAGVTMDLAHKYTGKNDDVRPTLIVPAGTSIAKNADTGAITGTATIAELSFTGSLNSPANVATAWTDTDKLKIVVKYDIYPQVQAAE